MKNLLNLLSIVLLIVSQATAQELEWGYGYQGAGISLSSMTTDNANNVYNLGRYASTIDLDPGAAVFNLSTGGADNEFVQKLDANGNLLWAKRISGNGGISVKSCATDQLGALYIAGDFVGSFRVNPGMGTDSIHAPLSYRQSFLLKWDINGDFLWVKQSFYVTGISLSGDVGVDENGNVITTESFFDEVIFDIDAAGDELLLSAPSSGSSIVVQKRNTFGDLLWYKHLPALGGIGAKALDTDHNNNIYITGEFTDTVDFDPGPLDDTRTGRGLLDIFILKIDEAGNYQWVKQIGDEGTDLVKDLLVAFGQVITCGQFTGTVDFDPGAGTNTMVSAGPENMFLLKLDVDGDFVWARHFEGNNVTAHGISADGAGNIFSIVNFAGTTDADPGPGTHNLTSSGGFDLYISKLTTDGELLWASQLGTSGTETSGEICTDGPGNVYATGRCGSGIDLDPGMGTVNVTGTSFILKWSDATVAIQEQTPGNMIRVYPNPTTGYLILEATHGQNITGVTVSDISGKIILQQSFLPLSSAIFSLDCPPGLYFIGVQHTGDQKAIFKVVKE